MPKTNIQTIHMLEKKIAAERCKLQKLYDARGYTDSVVLIASIKLDKLLNQYRRLSGTMGQSLELHDPDLKE
jgi:hypothetical protein